jgi:hypothetical protein
MAINLPPSTCQGDGGQDSNRLFEAHPFLPLAASARQCSVVAQPLELEEARLGKSTIQQSADQWFQRNSCATDVLPMRAQSKGARMQKS